MIKISIFGHVMLSLFIICNLNTGWAQSMKNQKGFESIEIKEAIKLVAVKKHQKMLIEFKNRFQEGDSFLVTSHSNHFEIIVTHPGQGNSSGGAEQYLLDKNTGESKMGWHEHPMETQILEEIDITSD